MGYALSTESCQRFCSAASTRPVQGDELSTALRHRGSSATSSRFDLGVDERLSTESYYGIGSAKLDMPTFFSIW